MPIFEFVCKKCNKEFEILVFSSDEKIECPSCKSGETSKRLSNFASPTSSSSANSCGASDYCPSSHKHKCLSGCRH